MKGCDYLDICFKDDIKVGKTAFDVSQPTNDFDLVSQLQEWLDDDNWATPLLEWDDNSNL